MPKKNLHRQVKGILEDKSDKLNLISGSLGITIDGQKTVEVSNREGYVWVRLRGSQSELIQAYNASVSPIFDLPVLVVRQGNKYAIYGRDIQRYDNWGITPYLPKHGTQHSFSPENGQGGDVTWIYSRQFVPMLASPSGTSGAGLLNINPSVYRTPEGAWEFIGDTSTPNILVAKPTDSQARMMLLYWDLDTDAPAMLTGTTFSATLTGTASVLPYIPTTTNSRRVPLAGIRLVSGTSVVGWDNIYDLRQFAVNVPPSFSGGFGIMEEGVIQGTGTILNFIGEGVTALVSGSIARIHVTAVGSGGESLWTTGSAGNYSITTKDGANDSRAGKAFSHGISNIADGLYSHAEGNDTLATGSASHSEGGGTVARGVGSHAEGQNTVAVGLYSHAEGIQTIASGSYSHAEGEESIAFGRASHVAGLANEAHGAYSAVIAGDSNAVYGQNSSILAGNGITGSADNTSYTDLFNVKRLNTGTAIANVGINAQGFLVTGSVGAPGGGSSPFTTGSAGTTSIRSANASNDATGNYSFAVGFTNIATGDASSVLAGQTNKAAGTNSSVISGNGITGSADNTAYTDFFNIKDLANGSPAHILGRSSDGSIVTGTASALPVQDAGGYYSGTTAESILQEIWSYTLPAFTARQTSGNATAISATSVGVVKCNSEDIDTGNCHNPSTGRFTPLTAGTYLIKIAGALRAMTADKDVWVGVRKNGTTTRWLGLATAATNGDGGAGGAINVYLNGSTDYVEFVMYNGDSSSRSTYDVDGTEVWWQGHRISPLNIAGW